jgi:predicted nucleotidyltransferase
MVKGDMVEPHESEEGADPVLDEAVRRIVSGFSPRRILLFGSRAWGRARDSSDYDLLVIVDRDGGIRSLEGEIRWELLDLEASFDIIVRSSSWWSEHSKTLYTLENKIERDGRELHVA